MLAIGVNYKWDACPSNCSTQAPGPPTYQIIKVTNLNHMSMMKTNLTTIPMFPRERFALYKSSSRLVLCYKKDWAILLQLSYTCYLLPVINYFITQLSVTDNFSVCREYLTENRLPFPSAPRWVRHFYLLKGLDRSPILVGHQDSFLAPLPGSEAPLVGGIW